MDLLLEITGRYHGPIYRVRKIIMALLLHCIGWKDAMYLFLEYKRYHRPTSRVRKDTVDTHF
jgi:hypothetical protein